MSAELIKQAYLLTANAELVGAEGTSDVLIENGRIAAIAPFITDFPPETTVIDGRSQFLGPGLIDLYSQSGEPGHESRETYASLRAAAAAGGFTRVGLLPTVRGNAGKLATDNVDAIATIHQKNRLAAGRPQLLPWAAITHGANGQQMTELAELAGVGALGFTDGAPLTNRALLRRLLEYAQPLQKTIALWPCETSLVGGGIAREGADALRLGLSGVSAIAETTALATLLEYVVEVPALVHIMRVSTARGVELIRAAKSRNLPISASVPWHHLLFDTSDLVQYHPSLRHQPPVGNPADRQALVEGVADGVIDAIAIDHSPYTYEEKTVSFSAAPPGAIGLELALPILWQTFVASSASAPGRWSPMQLWHLLSEAPARCLGTDAGQLEVGAPAELTLFDPRIEWQVEASSLRSLAYNTPWQGQTLKGKVTRIWAHQPSSLSI